MALTAAPYGLQPISDQAGTVRTVRIPNGIASGLISPIYKYAPVKMVAASGTIAPIAATTDPIFGVFAGVEYTPLGGRPVVSPFWPAGTVFDPNFDMLVYIWPAWSDSMRFRVQANGPVPQTSLGREFNFNVASVTAGSTASGLSNAFVSNASVGVGVQGQLALTEFYTDINDTIGDAFGELIVIVALGQVGAGPTTSIG